MCLVFDENLKFPTRRVDLYKEAIEALLRKWDVSRNIRRDEFYKNLSNQRKEQLLSKLAFENFLSNRYFIAEEAISLQIENFLNTLPKDDRHDEQGGSLPILKAIESQHGLIIERAHKIYSFSHLTFQEYLAGRHLFEKNDDAQMQLVILKSMESASWREVLLMTASLFASADNFFARYAKAIRDVISSDQRLGSLMYDVEKNDPPFKSPVSSASSSLPTKLGRALKAERGIHFAEIYEKTLELAEPLNYFESSAAGHVRTRMSRLLAAIQND